ncbi:MAG TPA: prepilin peptidase [Deltaproteobacteria bacterium]|jgi:leader peptidase (prepilin peptidase)/N-methyltransferase|nr:prepilin peptidase [Deltaproteobacteria bacterium]HRW80801.1 prepilin peptidase [Desulfomonilia bacterium]NMD40468.1 prepilin peptidase [Deltaproteobacteria bacterium]HNQ86008.1 prepilin peptidase [Deltaproteobacteria bacterium]HNS90376.1 prepilin peptidase [Deltaproteobacteria bacterium]
MAVLAALVGLFIGSFLNVCIYRIPRNESIVWPGSRCTKCGNPIRYHDNIPVISYLVLRGKCRFCSEPISVRYPVVELISALLAVSLLYRFGPTLSFVIYYAWACVLLVITFIDLDFQIIPDRFTLGGIVTGLPLVYFLPVSYKDALIGLVLGGGLLLVIIYGYYFMTRKEGMGGGDVKLLAMIGVFTGWQGVLFTVFASSLIGTLVGLPWAYLNKGPEGTLKAAIPFGPFLALGALIYVLWGAYLIDWYFGFLG